MEGGHRSARGIDTDEEASHKCTEEKKTLHQSLLVMEEKVKSGWVDTDCKLVVVFFVPRKLEDNIFRVVQLFMFGDLLRALSLLMQRDLQDLHSITKRTFVYMAQIESKKMARQGRMNCHSF